MAGENNRHGRESARAPASSAPPSVAVIIPCWNAEPWIARSIQSVLDQDYPNLSLIVVDDGSPDQSLEIVKSFGDRLTWLTGPNAGAPEARNRGEAVSDSEFVLFLDADDYIEGPLISGMVAAAVAGGADLVLGPTVIESPDGKRSARTGCAANSPNPDLVRAWLKGAYVQAGGQLWRRTFLNEIGGWDARVRRIDDMEIALRGLLAGAKVAISHPGVAVWCNHDDPRRLSRQVDEKAWRSIQQTLSRLGQVAAECYPGLELDFARELYAVARRALAHGCHRAGVAALENARALGLRGHPGSPRRALLCRMIGMPRAEYLVIGVRLIRTTLKRFRRRLRARFTTRPASSAYGTSDARGRVRSGL
jgi:hypothetical protein